jgi:hypothetical protein
MMDIKKLVINTDLSEVNLKLDRILRREKIIMATLEEAIAIIKPLKSKVEGLNVLMDNMRQQIADLLANGGVTPALQAKIDEVFTDAKALSDEITVAVDENVPPAPPEPTA